MLAQIIIDGVPHRFRISWLSRHDSLTALDVELTDISEVPTDKYVGKRIDHYKWKEAIRSGFVKII